MLNFLEIIFVVLLYITFLLTAAVVSLIVAREWVWSDRTFTRLLYFLIVGLFFAVWGLS
jgi:hypothetical protein